MSLITFAVDSFLTGGRGTPNAISPGSDGSSWTPQRGVQTPSYSSNQGVFTCGSDTHLGVWTYGSMAQTDQEVLVNVLQTSGNDEIVGAVLRCSDSGHFYYADIGNNSGNIEFGKCTPAGGGTFTALATAPFSSSFGTKYSLRFQAVGNVLKAKIWDASTAEPTNWSIQFSDNTYSSGLAGICMAPDNSSACKFDTFSITNGATVSSNPVDPSYGAEQKGLVAGAASADLVPAQDISAYARWSLQIDTIATGATLTFQGSNDGTNFRSIAAYKDVDDSVVSTTTAVGMFSASRKYRWIRVRQTAYSSGLTTGTFELFAHGA